MSRTLIRLDDEVPPEVLSAFPQLVTRSQRAHSTIVGDVADQQELQGLLNFLSSLGYSVVEVVTIPD